MSTENLDKYTPQNLAPEDTRTPDDSAPSSDGLPNDGGENPAQDVSWEEANKKLSGDDLPKVEEPKPEDRISTLQAELEEIRKAKETAEKRMSDTKREFTNSREEIKSLRAELEELRNQRAEKPDTQDQDSQFDESALEDAEMDFDAMQEEYGLTEEERENLEINPELLTTFQKMVRKDLVNRIAEHDQAKEKAQQEARQKALEAEIEAENQRKWLDGARQYHADAEELINSRDFQVWAEANADLRQQILSEKDKYDPSGVVELIDIYKEKRSEIDRIRRQREYGRSAVVSHQSMTGTPSRDTGEKSWDQINRELEQRS